MTDSIATALARLRPISLAALNSKAAMLERLDNKYIVAAADMAQLLPLLAPHFDVLEIGGKRVFTYRTCYFDDARLTAYRAHHQGRRRRAKVRVRDYCDAGLRFLEIKLKDRRSITVKKRLKLPPGADALDRRGLDFIDAEYRALYGEPFPAGLDAVIRMEYRRITLVAREGGERMTIDTGLVFRTEREQRAVDPGLFIIETKSERANGLADKILRSLHLHPTKRVSKYCVGMASMGRAPRANRFLLAMRRLGLAPFSDGAYGDVALSPAAPAASRPAAARPSAS